MQPTNLKKLPPLETDEEAERFLENEDLSEYDWSGAKRAQLRLRHETEEIVLSLPAEVVSALKKKAANLDLQYSQYLTQLLEQAAR